MNMYQIAHGVFAQAKDARAVANPLGITFCRDQNIRVRENEMGEVNFSLLNLNKYSEEKGMT